VSVLVGVVFGGFRRVVLGLHVMAVSYVGVMAGFLVVACIVMFRCHAMVSGRMFVVVGGLHVMISTCFRHSYPL
jgi:hypothetical protein